MSSSRTTKSKGQGQLDMSIIASELAQAHSKVVVANLYSCRRKKVNDRAGVP